MQPTKGNSTYVDMDEADGGGIEKDENSRDSQGNSQSLANKDDLEDNDENVTEQTHHIIVPSFR
jgi:hypothetical protein